MDTDTCRMRFAGADVVRLATCGPEGPHLVPIVCAVAGDTVVFAVDHKPKRTRDLQRIRNLRRDPRAALLADHYEPDWSRLWWVRADGVAEVIDGGPDLDAAVDLLVSRHEPYAHRRPAGPAVVISVHRWSGWAAAGER